MMMSLIQTIALAFGTFAVAVVVADIAMHGIARSKWTPYTVPFLALCAAAFLFFPR